MAPRPPRRPPSPPSRDRSRARVPGVQMPQRPGLAYENTLLQGTPTTRAQRMAERASASKPPALTAQARARRNMSYDTALALQDARAGDDSELLPYQPTPSIDPPRPRTLAAGYDPDTKTLRVRFRDGTPWEYYDVPNRVWQNFKRVKSPGRHINRVLNNYEYARGNF